VKKYQVRGPNLADYRISTWYYDELDGPLGARAFADRMANEVDTEYEILEVIGIVRQIPLPPRPLEFVTPLTHPKGI
jgi:hypothetical protein